ncbi:hypothetical protein RFI_00931 [Reticulomyxa filosa]|uniref:Methyltransferase domain-containing protein n=1 Tax=Reticulomyxa filosa TaxID=46433 RepID=X6PD31_RETFI|nr:hypothetical protein RFI_00931 [Reticulomyxa filosa]|eukprot:ETO36131.1 hypothetical protein RFI_00931 [Reticulomyxa filosa]
MTEGCYSHSIADGTVDFGKRSDDYVKYRPGFPENWFERLDKILFGRTTTEEENSKEQEKEKRKHLVILDLGSGPGVITLELGRRKGYENCEIMGVDISSNQIAAARKRVKEMENEKLLSCKKIEFKVGSAEDIPMENASVDVIICGQCWPFFDTTKAWPSIHRVLKESGLLIIAQYCYLPRMSYIAHITEQLVYKYNPSWIHGGFNGIYPSQIDQVFYFFIVDNLIFF